MANRSEFSVQIFLLATCSAQAGTLGFSQKGVDTNFRRNDFKLFLSTKFKIKFHHTRIIRIFVFLARAQHEKISPSPLITATALVLQSARDSIFGFICPKKRKMKSCHAHSKPVVSSYQFHMHTASDTPTGRQAHTHTFASHPLCPITVVVRAHRNRLTEPLSRGTWLSITKRKKNQLSPFFSARITSVDSVCAPSTTFAVANHSSG